MNTEDIANILRTEIGSAQIAPGERLVEAQLCKRFGVGRGKIREALRQLEYDLCVKITPHVGAEVREITQKDIEQAYDLMGVLEGLSIRVGTPGLSDEDIQKIEAYVQQMEASDNPVDFFRSNFNFHKFLASLSENSHLDAFMRILRTQAYRFGLHGMYNPEQMQASIREHKKILEAIKERKGQKAEKLTRDHFLNAKKRLIRYINKSL